MLDLFRCITQKRMITENSIVSVQERRSVCGLKSEMNH